MDLWRKVTIAGILGVFLSLSLAQIARPTTIPLTGAGKACGTTATSIFTQTINANSTGTAGLSVRQPAVTSGAGGCNVRVTFFGSPSATTTVANASICVATSTYNCAAVPVELKFSGSSGYTLGSGASTVSDWASLSFATGATLTVVVDITTNDIGRTTATTFNSYESNVVQTSYNVQSPPGVWNNFTVGFAFSKIEAGN